MSIFFRNTWQEYIYAFVVGAMFKPWNIHSINVKIHFIGVLLPLKWVSLYLWVKSCQIFLKWNLIIIEEILWNKNILVTALVSEDKQCSHWQYNMDSFDCTCGVHELCTSSFICSFVSSFGKLKSLCRFF